MKNAMVRKACPEPMGGWRFQEFLVLFFREEQPIDGDLSRACEEFVEVLFVKVSFNAGIFSMEDANIDDISSSCGYI